MKFLCNAQRREKWDVVLMKREREKESDVGSFVSFS